MDERTRTELEFLAQFCVHVRSSTLRLLRQMTDQELRWRPSAAGICAGEVLAHLAAVEDLRVHHRLAGKTALPAAPAPHRRAKAKRQGPPNKAELGRSLKRLRAATRGFLRDLILGRRRALAPDVLAQIERLVLLENQCVGQVQLLRAMHAAARETNPD